MIDRISTIRELLTKPSYSRVKRLLEDESYWNKHYQPVLDYLDRKGVSKEDKFSKYGFIGSSIGVLLAGYAIIRQELSNLQGSEELRELKQISNEIKELQNEINRAMGPQELRRASSQEVSLNYCQEAFIFPHSIVEFPVQPKRVSEKFAHSIEPVSSVYYTFEAIWRKT